MAKKAVKPRHIGRNKLVTTIDGNGTIIKTNMRKNTNGGPGVRQYIVRLDDGRVRHYNIGDSSEDAVRNKGEIKWQRRISL